VNQPGLAPKRELINPPGTEKVYERLQFSQAVKVGDIIWVSGQVGRDPGGNLAEGIQAQARAALENLKSVLEHAGACLGDVVELTTFHTSMKDIMGFAQAKADFFPQDYPAWTAVGVTELVYPGLLVEVRAVAVMGSSL
jgi:enamine deaminase RidA (YjgF/YER057c/UK114 family)